MNAPHTAREPALRCDLPTRSTRLLAYKLGALGFVVFNHPERHNAMSVDMWQALPEALSALAGDPEIRVLILLGAGELAFVSGADISEFASARANLEAEQRYAALTAPAFDALAALPQPSIAMIRGYCVGGGLAIALSCDLRIAADDARFAIPAARLGLGYSIGGVQALTNVVGPANAKDMLFSGRQLDAREALRIGLVNRVVPGAELEPSVRTSAAQIADNAPLTVRACKLTVNQLLLDPVHRDLTRVNASIDACFDSHDYAEGRRAFVEKRRPRFQGR